MANMAEPGFYKNDFRALSLKELVRMGGFLKLPLSYLISRFKPSLPAGWAPLTWSELQCHERDLSKDCLQAMAGYREILRGMDFSEVGFKKVKLHLNPSYRDSGGMNFLDSGRRHFGQLLYTKFHSPPPIDKDIEQISVTFTAALGNRTLNYSNNTRTAFDSAPNHPVVRIDSKDIAHVYQCFLQGLRQRKVSPQCFHDQS